MRTSLLFRKVASFSQLYYQSAVLDYPLNHQDPTLLNNKSLMDQLNTNFTHILTHTTQQLHKKVLDKLHQAGKLVVRERIEKLIDPGSPFLEFSPLAGH